MTNNEMLKATSGRDTDDIYRLLNGDCLDIMPTLEAGQFDLILTDPPYGTMLGAGDSTRYAGKYTWDIAIDTAAIYSQATRLLRDNGVLVLFSQEPYTAQLITNQEPGLPFLYRMAWIKDSFGNHLGAANAPVQMFEDVLVYRKLCNRYDQDNRNPVREYAAQVFKYIGRTKRDIMNQAGDQAMDHFFRFNSMQFTICTYENYLKLIYLFNLEAMPGFRTYADISDDNDNFLSGHMKKINETTPAVFNLAPGKNHKPNLLHYKKDLDKYHETQKPVNLLADLIQTYTRPGDSVLDFTMGSGSTGVAAKHTGRKFTGIELNTKFFNIAAERIEASYKQTGLFEKSYPLEQIQIL